MLRICTTVSFTTPFSRATAYILDGDTCAQSMALLAPCPIHCVPKLTRGCQESIPGMKNDVTLSCCGHINHTITISSSLDTNLDFSLLPLPFSLHSYITVFPLLLHHSLTLLPFFSASSADAPCHSSYFSLLKFPNWSQLEPPQSERGSGGVGGKESAYVYVCLSIGQREWGGD